MERVYRSELTPTAFLARSAALFPDRPAVVHLGRQTTYRELAERVARLAGALILTSLERGDRVAVVSPNTQAMLELTLAVPAAGLVLVPVNVRLNAGEVAHIIGHSGARLAFVDHELADLVEVPPELGSVLVCDTGSYDDPYERFLWAGAGSSGVVSPADEEDVISINYTSGTTGRPKGVMVTHRGTYLNAIGQVIEAGLDYGSVYLWTLPMFHCNGWCYPWAVTAVAGTHICLRKADPGVAWALLESEGVTHFCCAPTVAIALVHDPAAHRLERPVTVVMGGAPPSPTLVDRLEALHFRLLHAYGLTETYGPITCCVPHPEWSDLSAPERAHLMARQGVGHLTSGPVRVDAERGAMGEVLMRGNIVMKGYHADPEATAAGFDGGWFHSGDLAVEHPDAYIELRDRAKDVIISGGENIATIEVEQAVVAHPAVMECAVVAMPDEKWGERPKAFVTLKPGRVATEPEIIDFCRGRIAHFKCPSAVEFGQLPKTSTGKIQKHVLREREWSGLDRRVN